MKTKKSIIVVLFVLLSAQIASAYYCPSTGRWLSRDQIGEVGFTLLKDGQQAFVRKTVTPKDLIDQVNKIFINIGGPNYYEFVNDNPVSVVDPDGLWPWSKKKCCDVIKDIGKAALDKMWDDLKDAVKDKIKDYLGGKTMKDAYDACNQIKCMDHSAPQYELTCQLCSIFQCGKDLPATAIALDSCLKEKWAKCALQVDP